MKRLLQLRGATGIALALLASLAFAIPLALLLALGKREAARKLVSPWSRAVLAALGTRVELTGRIPDSSQGFVVAAAHTSMLDTFIYPALLGEKALYVGKSELRGVPVFGWVFEQLGYLFVRRGGGREASEQMVAEAAARGRGLSVFIHPEGTRSRDGELRQFKKGFVHLAIGTGKEVLPVVSFGGERLWRRDDWLPLPGTVRVVIGSPLPTAAWRSEEADRRCAEAREALCELRRQHGGGGAECLSSGQLLSQS